VAHLIRDKKALLARVRRIRGQLDAVERSLSDEADCADTLQLIASSRGALNGLMAELLEGHIRYHVVGDGGDPRSQAWAVDQLVALVRAYMK
jgi:DNA-binding FrmR family transcriptional regulator